MIEFTHVSKAFGAQEVLRDVTFRINRGERLGIVGPNGTGKTTVFSLVCGESTPDRGSIEVNRSARIGYLHQEFSPHSVDASVLDYAESGRPDLEAIHTEIETLEEALRGDAGPGRDGMLERLGELQTDYETGGGYGLGARAEAALFGLGFAAKDLSRPFREFSGGWQMRAELARVLVANPDVLLLDEPTNYLDIPAIEWLQKHLKVFSGTMLLVSHDRYLLNSLTTTTVEIANAEATRYQGNYDYYVTQRKLRNEQLLAALKNQDRERERIQRFIDRFRSKNTKASQVQSKMKMLERMPEIIVQRDAVGRGTIRLDKPPSSGHEVVRLEDAGLTYDDRTWVLRDISMSVHRCAKIALVGLNGTGKTTLLRLLAGRLALSEGKHVLGHKVTVGYQSQEFAETMDPDATVFATINTVGKDASTQKIRNLLGGFGFSGAAIDKKVGVLSGGEKVRLAFARLLVNPPNFLVLDEPTTHLDVNAREVLEVALQDLEATVCFVSHDIAFTRAVATDIVAMRPPGMQWYCGGYDYYCDKMAAEAAPDEPSVNDRQLKVSDRKDRRRDRARIVQEFSRRKRHLETNIAQAEKRIDELEKEQAELTKTVQQPGPRTDYEATNRRLTEIRDDLGRVTKLWEQAATEHERLNADRDRTLSELD